MHLVIKIKLKESYSYLVALSFTFRFAIRFMFRLARGTKIPLEWSCEWTKIPFARRPKIPFARRPKVPFARRLKIAGRADRDARRRAGSPPLWRIHLGSRYMPATVLRLASTSASPPDLMIKNNNKIMVDK